jgi:hypothetical protein
LVLKKTHLSTFERAPLCVKAPNTDSALLQSDKKKGGRARARGKKRCYLQPQPLYQEVGGS